jgi:hypothetical protein
MNVEFDDESLPDGWTVWTAEPDGRVILAYRPDVFEGESFPAPCLPTIYVTNGSPHRRPGAGAVETDTWRVLLFLEPDVDDEEGQFDDRESAVGTAIELAARFAAGEVDYRGLYQVPREAYLDELDRLTGRDPSGGSRRDV